VGFEPKIPVLERAKTVRALDRAAMRSAAVGIRHADHVAPSIRKKLALTSLTNGDRSVSIVRLRTEATGFFFFKYSLCTAVQSSFHVGDEVVFVFISFRGMSAYMRLFPWC
jgi:hypothetical protein